METVFTNVLDEREFYTFHRTPDWTSDRALADPRAPHRPHRRQQADPTERTAGRRLRSLEPGVQLDEPAVSGRPDHARDTDLRHRLDRRRVPLRKPTALCPRSPSPATRRATARAAELFRVYVFTDRQCLNRVLSQAPCSAAPRTRRVRSGPRAAASPSSAPSRRRAPRTCSDGSEPDSFTFDGLKVQSDRADGARDARRPPFRPTPDSDPGTTSLRSRPSADSDRQRHPRRAGRPLGHGLAGQRLLLDGHPRRSRSHRER